MRIGIILAAILAFVSIAFAEDYGDPSAFTVKPIHPAQVVRGDDGMDHVEYDLLVVSVLPEPVALTSVIVLDPAGKELGRIEGEVLAAATQGLFAHDAVKEIPASGAVAVEIDLTLPPGTAPDRLNHRIAYKLKTDSAVAAMYDVLTIDAPEVTVDRAEPITIKPPVSGEGWINSTGCCTPDLHRDLRIAIGGVEIETPELFAIDWARIKDGRIFDGDGSKNEQHYAFGEDVLAVGDGTVVSVRDGKPEMTPNIAAIAKTKDEYGGNHVILQIAPAIFVGYEHLQKGSVAVKVGDVVKAGAVIAKVGNTGPSMGPHLHFGLLDKPDIFAGRSLPFVFERFEKVGVIDFDKSEGDHVIVVPDRREVRSAYPLNGAVVNFP
ncbi:MAG: M23 family metallopeptidase [Hyphomicrobiales bacterium]